jgi:hypothetical protein
MGSCLGPIRLRWREGSKALACVEEDFNQERACRYIMSNEHP